MTFAADLYTVLHTGAVDALCTDRIFPVLAPQGVAKPYVVWRRNGGDPLAVLGADGKKRQVVDVFIAAYGETFDEADALGLALVDAINAASGSGKGKVAPPLDGFEGETKLFFVTYQARLFYKE